MGKSLVLPSPQSINRPNKLSGKPSRIPHGKPAMDWQIVAPSYKTQDTPQWNIALPIKILFSLFSLFFCLFVLYWFTLTVLLNQRRAHIVWGAGNSYIPKLLDAIETVKAPAARVFWAICWLFLHLYHFKTGSQLHVWHRMGNCKLEKKCVHWFRELKNDTYKIIDYQRQRL